MRKKPVEQIDFDFSSLSIQMKTQVMLAIRGALIDEYTHQYIEKHPNCTVIYLGCGLDARVKRVGKHAKHWYDLDFPKVIDLKKTAFRRDESISLYFIFSNAMGVDGCG